MISRVGITDFQWRVAMGLVPGLASVSKFGRNGDIDSAAAEDIWDAGGDWVAPTTARTHQIASSSASDATAGVGARTIRIFGLTGWTTAEVSEDVTLNGTTDVQLASSYVIIHRMQVLTKGATNVNVGAITATADTDSTVTAQIAVGIGQTQMAIYGVPSIQDAYMTAYYATIVKAAAAGAADMSLLVNPEPEAELLNFVTKHTNGMQTDGSTHLHHAFHPPNKISGPAIIKLRSSVTANNSDISAGFDLILADK